MSRFAVISDVHSNLHALQAVLDRIEALGIREIICLGDIVGYGPHPAECIDLVLERCATVVRGNHDDGVCDRAMLAAFNGVARAALLWTREALDPRRVNLLSRLPSVAHVRGAMCVHDSPQPGTAAYVHDARAAALAFRGVESAICLLGHTHVPAVFQTDSLSAEDRLAPRDVRARMLRAGDVVELDPGSRYILNPGSVGQPRDTDPRASFAILDLEAGLFELHREAYDVASVQAATARAGLPAALAQRLAVGA